MRDETRNTMNGLIAALRQGWNAGALSLPGAELVLLAAVVATDPDAFAGFSTPELKERMQALFEAVRAEHKAAQSVDPSEPLPPVQSAALERVSLLPPWPTPALQAWVA